MGKKFGFLVGLLLMLAVLQSGCEKSSPPQVVLTTTPRVQANPIQPTPSPVPPALPTAPAYAYAVRDRRDPFISLVSEEKRPLTTNPQLGKVEILSLTLSGILVDNSGPLALVKTADGQPIVLRAGDQLADGRLVAITEEELIFERELFGEVHRIVLKLSKGGS